MGFFNNLLGGVSGNKGGAGLNYNADLANIQKPITDQNALAANGQVDQGLAQQQAFLQALQQQHGAANQSNVFGQGQNIAQALAGQGGIQNQNSVFQQQQGLANQLQGVANGTGPNPAQAQLAQATAQNVAQQAALQAGQRGGSANPALIARQAAMQGANIQQQAAGQSATMQANQQLAALGALQNQQAQLGQTAGTQVAQQLNNQGQLANQAAQQVNQQAGAIQGFNSAAQGNQSNIFNAIGNQNAQQVGSQNNVNSNNAAISNTLAGQQGNFGYGAINNAGKGLMGLMGAEGGVVPRMADGGAIEGPQSNVGKFLRGVNTIAAPQADTGAQGVASQTPIATQAGNTLGDMMTKGLGSLMGGAPASVGAAGAGEAGAAAAGGGGLAAMAPVMSAALLNKGGEAKAPIDGESVEKVPGKAKVKGNNLKNDTVPALLSPGEVVIPKSVMESGDPVANAAKFVQAVMAKHNMKTKRSA